MRPRDLGDRVRLADSEQVTDLADIVLGFSLDGRAEVKVSYGLKLG